MDITGRITSNTTADNSPHLHCPLGDTGLLEVHQDATAEVGGP
ncbi:MAG: hypothetical protein V3U84_11860 [Thiotrichaceae bacterium]